MEKFHNLEKHVYGIMKDLLPEYLTYHSIAHTKHVVDRSEYIARQEEVLESDIDLLKTAALYHDIGFISTYKDHEEMGCSIVQKELPDKGYSAEDIEKICGMIMATKIPQSPTNHLENIIADADLEYLGTEHFEKIGDLLYQELRHFNSDLSVEEWNQIQVKFLNAHKYHTEFCSKHREWRKNENMRTLL